MPGYLTLEDGVRLYYEKLGDGRQTVLIPNGLYMLEDFKRLVPGRTLIFYDVRNRGRSDFSDGIGGIHQDVEDLEGVRQHFELEQVVLIGHSYIGILVALYAMRYPRHVNRAVMIGPPPPDSAKKYPPELTNVDGVLTEVFAKLGQLPKESDPVQSCRNFWSVLRAIYVANPAHADRIQWDRCEIPNERNFMKYWTEQVNPSLQNLNLSASQFENAKAPILIVHGRKDRSAPYGGAKDWALLFPDAQLLTVENVAHAPWIEAPEEVFSALTTFLDSSCP